MRLLLNKNFKSGNHGKVEDLGSCRLRGHKGRHLDKLVIDLTIPHEAAGASALQITEVSCQWHYSMK